MFSHFIGHPVEVALSLVSCLVLWMHGEPILISAIASSLYRDQIDIVNRQNEYDSLCKNMAGMTTWSRLGNYNANGAAVTLTLTIGNRTCYIYTIIPEQTTNTNVT